MSRRRGGSTTVVALLAALAVTSAACQSGPQDADGSPGDPPTDEPEEVARPDTDGLVPEEGGDPPETLGIEEVVVGDGEEAVEGDLLAVHYVGVRWSDGGEFDSSWERGSPFAFTLGAGEVIEGWDLGVEGMREGGRRILTVPAELAYGDRSVAGAFGAGETLVFVVDLITVEP